MAWFGFLNPGGMIAFFVLLPLILLYLVRPKPITLDIPSVLFFSKNQKSKNQRSFLRHFMNELLFFLHLLILSLLAFAVMQPWIEIETDVVSDNVILVLDVSASMQTMQDGELRFDLAREKAFDLLGVRTSIVLAGETPIVALDHVPRADAKSYLRGVQPRDTTSNIGEAIVLGGELLRGNKGRVVVLSDFASTHGLHPSAARDVLLSLDIPVDFIVVGKQAQNVGIVDLTINDDSSAVYVKNYFSHVVTVPLFVNNDAFSLTIQPRDIEALSFKTPSGVTQIRLDFTDDLSVDNDAWIVAPEEHAVKVLVVSSLPSPYLLAALASTGQFAVTVVEPPIIPDELFDVYIFQGLHVGDLLPGTFRELGSRVRDGASIIVYGDSESHLLSYDDLLPVILGNLQVESGIVGLQTVNRITRDVQFGTVTEYFATEAIPESVSLAAVDIFPLVNLISHGKGYVVYYGLFDAASDFPYSPSYPIFWVNLIKFLGGMPVLGDVNVRTGSSLHTFGSDITSLDHVGVYAAGNFKIAANLLSDTESAVDVFVPPQSGTVLSSYLFTPVEEDVAYDIVPFLLLFVFVVSLIELVYVKVRGDI